MSEMAPEAEPEGSAPAGWHWGETSDLVMWVCERNLRGCWKCHLRALIRWPRPYRHFACGPVRDAFPGRPTLGDLISGEAAPEST